MAQGIGDALEGALIGLAIFCIALGALLMWLIPTLWSWAKPFIHTLTA